VVAFRFGQQCDPRDEAERAAEVVEWELPAQAAAAIALPRRDLASEPGDLRLWERWRPRRVFLAVLVDKLGNGRTVPNARRRVRAERSTARSSGASPDALWVPLAQNRGVLASAAVVLNLTSFGFATLGLLALLVAVSLLYKAPTRPCHQCGRRVPLGRRMCPDCGYDFEPVRFTR
jgi:hypothetical protein